MRATKVKVCDGLIEEVAGTETGNSVSSPPEIIDRIKTRASVQTGGAVTLVDVDVAVVAREADGAVAGVAARQVFARTAIQAGAGEALVDFQLAARPCRQQRHGRSLTRHPKEPLGMKDAPSSHL